MKTYLFKYIENFTTNFQMKNSSSFHISAQNIDCGYLLELISEVVLTSTHNLSVSGEGCAHVLVNCLRGLSLPRKSVVR